MEALCFSWRRRVACRWGLLWRGCIPRRWILLWSREPRRWWSCWLNET